VLTPVSPEVTASHEEHPALEDTQEDVVLDDGDNYFNNPDKFGVDHVMTEEVGWRDDETDDENA
jgi:hypothetical protein